MKKRLQIKSICAMVCIVVGIIVEILIFQLKGLSETQISYMNGFGISLTIVGIVILFKHLTTLFNPTLLKKCEIETNDERNIQISIRSMAIAFRICILLQALASVLLIILDNDGGLYLGFAVGIQLMVYLISYLFISKKI